MITEHSNHQQESGRRVWLITGASSGLGRALAVAALDAGDAVVGTARRIERFADLSAAYGDRFLAVAHDVEDVDGAAAVVERTVEAFGRIDVLVNNAGVGQVGTAEEIDDAGLRSMIAQHLLGPAAYVRAVAPLMRAARSGAIVQMSSQGGRRSFAAVGSYSAGKFALEGWSEALYWELRPFGITVMLVEPSRFRTGFNAPDVLRTAAADTAYDEVTAGVRAEMAGADGIQEGDPVRGAAAIRVALADPNPPLRLPLGAEAVRTVTAVYQEGLTEARRWASLSESADFPEASVSRR